MLPGKLMDSDSYCFAFSEWKQKQVFGGKDPTCNEFPHFLSKIKINRQKSTKIFLNIKDNRLAKSSKTSTKRDFSCKKVWFHFFSAPNVRLPPRITSLTTNRWVACSQQLYSSPHSIKNYYYFLLMNWYSNGNKNRYSLACSPQNGGEIDNQLLISENVEMNHFIGLFSRFRLKTRFYVFSNGKSTHFAFWQFCQI